MTTLTRTLTGWRLDADDVSVTLTAEAAQELARRILGLPIIERYVSPAKVVRG